MIKLGRMTDYGVVVMSHMAAHPGVLQTAADVVAATGLSLPTVSKLLHRLAETNMLAAVRGRNGGYRMERAADDISVAEIIRSFEGPMALTDCIEGGEGLCDIEQHCPIVRRWHGVTRAIERVLEDMTLADLLATPFDLEPTARLGAPAEAVRNARA